MTLWEVEIRVRPGRPNPEQARTEAEIAALAPVLENRFGASPPAASCARGYLLEGDIDADAVRALADELLVDRVLEEATVAPVREQELSPSTITVLRKPGVMDPVAESAIRAARDLGRPVAAARTFHRYRMPADAPRPALEFLAQKVFANEAIDQIVFGPLCEQHLAAGGAYEFVKLTVPLRGLDEEGLGRLSREGQLYLNVEEMQAIQRHFESLGRDPTDIELETLAQTWSEHCSHKTLRGPYEFDGVRRPSGLLKDTIMHATRTLDRDWCVSVFTDNAGVVRFDEKWNLCFKVETHNHPSAIEPYGGANTGVGGVVRDPMGTGLGARPICNTDVFCVAPPDWPEEDLPEGVLHPARILRGVVAGVRDYGNRMGIPTVNGAVCFDERYLGNPLVYCGTVGLIPADKSFGDPRPGDLIVAIGGRTGRDGIHGATFSSGELTSESETVSSGAVQIGNALTEKKLLDVLMAARDQGLYRAVTDCGAGGFSSAVGEMGAKIGARVRLENAPLKYEGLSYTEIWISEAQERMVLAVPPENWEALRTLAASEDVEAVVLGSFEPTGRLVLIYQGEVVGDLDMEFLHEGRPPIVHVGDWTPPPPRPHQRAADAAHAGAVLRKVLSSLNVASKEWIIRQYDHEVQGGSVVKPLVGVGEDGPSDAAVLTPVLGSARGIAIGCGIHPGYGDIDPYRMAASAIDEAIRNVVAVGGDPERTAILDNFCWGNTERPEIFGSLCRAAMACRDVAVGYGTPFISGKDSLNNEFVSNGRRIVIPPTLLISAMAIVRDVRRCVTMDFKAAGNILLMVGTTLDELGGSEFNRATGSVGGEAPCVDVERGRWIFAAIHRLITEGRLRSCHDLSEGGLAVALAESAFSGGLGADVQLADLPVEGDVDDLSRLFSESNSRFLLEVEPDEFLEVERILVGLPWSRMGEVLPEPILRIHSTAGDRLLEEPLALLKQAWKTPLAW